MAERIVRVSLHTHSTMSDGALSPGMLASRLAERGASYAALTDHDTVKGSLGFREALAMHGIGCIDGVELTVATGIGEAHLLAYGIDTADPGLVAMLPQASVAEVRGERKNGPRTSGTPSIEDAIATVHAAGGVAFLAHPLHLAPDTATLERLVAEFKRYGLDGIEAIYAGYEDRDSSRLLELAARNGLCVSAGGDFHETAVPGQSDIMDMPERLWLDFRDLLLRRSGGPGQASERGRGIRDARAARLTLPGRFAARIILPAVTAVALFVVTLFLVIIPRVESMMLGQKKETIRELTDSAVSILAEYEAKARNGSMTPPQARSEAAERVRDLRYGRENKDYFWITDMLPRMVMHPYRKDLEGMDVTDFRDEAGLAVFVEFVRAVTKEDEGYVEYLWQWKDDANRIVPKISFVRRFAPWDWVIGTGIYLEDVNAEIGALSSNLVVLCLFITLILTLVITQMAREGLAVERGKIVAENALRESRERYRALANASTDGTVIVMGDACTFANGAFLAMTGYDEKELQLLRIADLLAPHPGEEGLGGRLLEFSGGGAGSLVMECRLSKRSGEAIDILVSGSPISLGGRRGAVLSVKEANPLAFVESAADPGRSASDPGADDGSNREAEAAGIGSFRTRWSRRAGILEADPVAVRILGIDGDPGDPGLFALIRDSGEAEGLYRDLESGGAAIRRRLRVGPDDFSARDVILSAFLARDPEGIATRLECVMEDAGETVREERRLEHLATRVEAESLWLSGPVSALAGEVPSCPTGASVREAAAKMAKAGSESILISDGSGRTLGIVTSGDIVRRSMASGGTPDDAIGTIMTAPVVSIVSTASVSEAVASMKRSRTDRVALRAPDGAIRGMAMASDLAMLHAGSFEAMRQEALEAGSARELAGIASRAMDGLSPLVSAGARPRFVLRALAGIQDAITESLAGLAAEKLGEPPAEWMFMTLGSMGREEHLPGSDQDNALVWIHDGGDLDEEREYFLSFGSSLCSGLEEAGLPLCPGGVMASNPVWNAPLSDWRNRLERGIREPEPEQLLDLKILLDFRRSAGSRAIADALRRSAFEYLGDEPGFFIHLAKEERQRKTPHGTFRSSAGANLKELSAAFSGFARLYALKNSIASTNTFDRLDILADTGTIKTETRDRMADAYESVMAMRLARGLLAAFPRTPGAGVFSAREDALLAFALDQAALLQKRIGFDFLGSGL